MGPKIKTARQWASIWLMSLALILCYVIGAGAAIAAVASLWSGVTALGAGNSERGWQLMAYCAEWGILAALTLLAAPRLNAVIGRCHPNQPAS